jgi:hypothetical protein
MMSPRAFLGVIGAFTLIGALVWLWSPIALEDTDVAGTAVACGNVFSSKSGSATVTDQRNEMGRNLTGEGDKYPDRDYVAECRDAKRRHQAWATPSAIVGGALLLGAVLVRPRDRGSTS